MKFYIWWNKFKSYSKFANINKAVAWALFYINKRDNLMFDKQQIFDSLRVKEKGFFKTYNIFKTTLQLPGIQPKYVKEQKTENQIMIKFLKEECAIGGKEHGSETLHSNRSPTSSPTSEMAVVASSKKEQVDEFKAEALNFRIKTYAHLVLNYILAPLSSLDIKRNINSINLIIDTKDKILEWIQHFENDYTGIDIVLTKQRIETKFLLLSKASESQIYMTLNQTALLNFLNDIVQKLKSQIEKMRVTINNWCSDSKNSLALFVLQNTKSNWNNIKSSFKIPALAILKALLQTKYFRVKLTSKQLLEATQTKSTYSKSSISKWTKILENSDSRAAIAPTSNIVRIFKNVVEVYVQVATTSSSLSNQ